jgi:co-chaperonin GroES (HSP10)
MTGSRFSLHPINGNIFVIFQPRSDELREGSFLIAEPKHQGHPNRGKVIAIADDVTECKVGDEIVYDENAKGFKWEGLKIIPVHKDNVQAIVTK